VDQDGRLTGELDGPLMYGEGKVAALRGFAADHDLELAECWAYSDSASDLPMLRTVGSPVAVNPDAELAAVAGSEGWRVMRFEKLGRRLAVGATVVAAGAIGGSGTWLAARRRPGRRAPRRRGR
jgi:phosphoserine phosphatase